MDMSKRLAVQAVTLLTHLFSNPNTTAHTMSGAERFDNPNLSPRSDHSSHSMNTTTARMHEPNMAGHSSASDYVRPNAMGNSNPSAHSHMANAQTASANMQTAAARSTMGSVNSSAEAHHGADGMNQSATHTPQTDHMKMQNTPCRTNTAASGTNTHMGQSKPVEHQAGGVMAASVLASGTGMMLAEKVLSWTKQCMTSEDDRQALLDLQQEPDSHINQRTLIGRLDDYLEKHPQSMTELDALISKSGISQSELAEASKDIGSGLMANIGAGIKNMFA